MANVAVVTMVRDDAFFLAAWVRHYAGLFGSENCYVVSHGHGQEVARIAQGCNIIGIPGTPHPNFDMKRWRLLNHLVNGLRGYHRHVIVGDVDELVVLDPAAGGTLAEFLADTPPKRVLTPLGLEVLHRIDLEDAPAADTILGPRRHVRVAMHYSKPCVVSASTKIARGGHFTQSDKLLTPEHLYLMHLKFCDFGNYVETMNRRNETTRAVGVGPKEAAIGRHWFAEARGEDRAVFEGFAGLEMAEGFDMAPYRAAMHASWRPRGQTGFWQFDLKDDTRQHLLPERFSGVI